MFRWLRYPLGATALVSMVLVAWEASYVAGLDVGSDVEARPLVLYLDAPPGAFEGARFAAGDFYVEGDNHSLSVTVSQEVILKKKNFDPGRDHLLLHVTGAVLGSYQAMTDQAWVENPLSVTLEHPDDARKLGMHIPFGDFADDEDVTYHGRTMMMAGHAFMPRDYSTIELPDGAGDDAVTAISGDVIYLAAARLTLDFPVEAQTSPYEKVGRIVWDPTMGRLQPMDGARGLEVGFHFCSCLNVDILGSARTEVGLDEEMAAVPFTDGGNVDFVVKNSHLAPAFMAAKWVFGTFVVGGIAALAGRAMQPRETRPAPVVAKEATRPPELRAQKKNKRKRKK